MLFRSFLKGSIKDEGGNGHEPDLELPDTTTPEEGIYRAGDVFKTPRGEVRLDFYAGADRKWVVTYEPEGKQVRLDVVTMDKMVDSGEWVYQPKEVEELTLATINLLAATEGDPLSKFCCRQCGECAPKELLEEGKFPERIAWLRHHYKEKHPGMWGKMQAAVIPTEPSPLPKDLVDEARKYKTAQAFIKEGEYGVRRVRIDNWTPEDIDALHKSGYNIYMKDLYTLYAEGIDFTGLDPSVPSTFPYEIFPDKCKEVTRIPSWLKPGKSYNPLFASPEKFWAEATKQQPAIIPTEPSPPSPKQELEFVSDSPEYLAFTIDDIGYREKLDTAFETAIARAKGG